MTTRRQHRRAVALAAAGMVLASAAPAHAGLLGGALDLVDSTLVGVVSTAADTTGGLLDDADWGYAPGQTSMAQVRDAVRADDLWASGLTGRGIGVALVDTGVVPVDGLTSGNVVNGPDLSFESQAPHLRDLDGFGHGTHMAGIIAGNGSDFRGMAPKATLVNMRVGTSDGAVDVSQVVAAIDWAVQHRAERGIRVLALAFGTDGTQSSTTDPLAHAVESAWRAGIVVVAAGGNSGTQHPSLDNPARDPWVLSVGAADTKGSASSLDDVVPSFSSRGSSSRRVDLTAPGQSIVSLRNPGSYVDTEYPAAAVGSRLFKGSGSSQAAAVVAGATALLLEARPSLTPDQVKRLLVSTAQPMPSADAAGRGAGLLDVLSAATAPTPLAAAQPWPRSTGLGSLDAARGTHRIGDAGDDLVGEIDVFGKPWVPSVWAPRSAAGRAWDGGDWNGSTWTGSCWCGASWASATWQGAAWTSRSWSSRSWSSRSWSSRSWSSRSWSGDGWTSRSWSSRSWSGSSWSG